MEKYIKFSIKTLKNIIHSYEAKPILGLKKNNLKTTPLSFKYKNSKNKIFYIIRRTPGAGLFSNFIFVLNHLKIAESCGFFPIVDMENFPTIYNEKNSIKGSKNSWYYYFKSKKKYNLNKIYKSGKFILTKNKFFKSFSNVVDDKKFRVIFKKYFSIKNEYFKFVKTFVKKNFLNNKILAIHLRGTSYKTSANHPFPLTANQALNLIDDLIKKHNYTKLFLCTEDLFYFNLIKKKFGKKVIFLKDSYKSNYDNAFKIYPRKLHRFKLGRDILLEAILISKCDGFVYTTTNVSEFVKFLDEKKKLNYYSIVNGLNSSNEYIAKWLWFYKNLAPNFLGGFNKKTSIDND